jgi:hypothetical protein
MYIRCNSIVIVARIFQRPAFIHVTGPWSGGDEKCYYREFNANGLEMLSQIGVFKNILVMLSKGIQNTQWYTMYVNNFIQKFSFLISQGLAATFPRETRTGSMSWYRYNRHKVHCILFCNDIASLHRIWLTNQWPHQVPGTPRYPLAAYSYPPKTTIGDQPTFNASCWLIMRQPITAIVCRCCKSTRQPFVTHQLSNRLNVHRLNIGPRLPTFRK